MFNLNQEYPYLEEVNPGITRLLPQLSSDSQLRPRILDCGCGRGALSDTLSRRGYEVWGIESNPAAGKVASGRLHRLLRIDLTSEVEVQYLLGQEKFDYIIFSDVLEHLYDPLQTLKFYRQFLKPEGRILISLPNIANWESRFKLFFGFFNYQNTGVMDRTHIRFFTFNTAQLLAREAGLKVEKLDCDPYLIRACLPLIKAIVNQFTRQPAESSADPALIIIDSSLYKFYNRWLHPLEYLLTSLWSSLLSFRIILVAKHEPRP